MTTRVEIRATAAAVWDTLVAFDGYERWNPLFPGMRARAAAGAELDMRVQLLGLRVAIPARVVTADPGRQLRWRGPRHGEVWWQRLIGGEHYFRIEPLGPDRVLVEHGETFSGALVPWVRWCLVPLVTVAYNRVNDALKRTVERANP